MMSSVDGLTAEAGKEGTSQIYLTQHPRGINIEIRHRLSKEIAEELIVEVGAGAHLYCLEKMANDTQQPKLWRDVLTWLDEIETKGEQNANAEL